GVFRNTFVRVGLGGTVEVSFKDEPRALAEGCVCAINLSNTLNIAFVCIPLSRREKLSENAFIWEANALGSSLVLDCTSACNPRTASTRASSLRKKSASVDI